jgi:hypothetical protein
LGLLTSVRPTLDAAEPIGFVVITIREEKSNETCGMRIYCFLPDEVFFELLLLLGFTAFSFIFVSLA